MSVKNEDSFEKILADSKSFWSSEVKKKMLIDGPNYKWGNKLLAFGCLQKEGLHNELEAIFHLTESHGASLRSQAIHLFQCTHNRSESKNHNKNFNGSLLTELDIDHLSFDSFNNGYPGLFDRLKEMPNEWTIVQLTFRYNEIEPWPGRLKDEPPKMLDLHVTRLPCGQLADERGPSTMFVEPHEVDKDLGSVLEIIQKSIKLITEPGKPKMKQIQREKAGVNMKNVTREIVSFWLKEWSCLMIGTLRDENLNKLVKSTIDTVVAKEKFPEQMISKLELSVLYQIADGCAHITENDIINAVQFCILNKPDNDRICQLFIDSICKLKKEHSHRLMRAERNPVLLVLDDDVEAVPWEMIPVLFRHPVSRIPSVHFAQVLYNKHKDDIVNGLRIVKNTDTSFYIVNPDRDLSKTEEKLLKFFKDRLPNWSGVHGEKPTRELFVKCLTDFNVLMYSGHGNGAQFLSPEDICRMNINIVPLLFGCSSASKQHFGEGGKPEMFGLSDHFLLAGCPCLVGMLWAVTSNDIDLVTVTLLNMTVSGEPINMNHIFGGQDLPMIKKEPELLRALKVARSVPNLYTNGAALIARGIPVKFED